MGTYSGACCLHSPTRSASRSEKQSFAMPGGYSYYEFSTSDLPFTTMPITAVTAGKCPVEADNERDVRSLGALLLEH